MLSTQRPSSVLRTKPTHSLLTVKHTDPLLEDGFNYLQRLLENIEKAGAYPATLVRLKGDLENAIVAYESALQAEAPSSDTLDQRNHLLWLCNQCRYYLSAPYSPAEARASRAQWQMKKIVVTSTVFKLISHVHNLLPGKKAIAPKWQEILSGFSFLLRD